MKRFLVALSLLLAAGCSGPISQKIEISQEQIQSSLASAFPYSTDDLESFDSPVKVTLTDPVALLEKGRDQLGVQVTVTVYRPERTLDRVRDRVAPKIPGAPALPELPPASVLDEEKVAGAVTIFGDLHYDPQTGKLFFRDAKITDSDFDKLPEKLRETARKAAETLVAKYLNETPVYTVKTGDFSGNLAKALLKSVTVENGKLFVELGL